MTLKKIPVILICFSLILCIVGCTPFDSRYGMSSVETTEPENIIQDTSPEETRIMSSDRVMSKYFDISLFDEENYADIYLGKRFKIEAIYMDDSFPVPCKIDDMTEKGWTLAQGNTYDENSLVFSYETIDAEFVNENGAKIYAQFYNSSRSSVKLSECNIVKFRIKNDFYTDNQSYTQFDVSGINNRMAITDIIDTLGTPSHFYEVSDTSYYLDYFLTKKDRRNGITVYINPVDDTITDIEFSYYE